MGMLDFVTGVFDDVVNWVVGEAGEAVGAVVGDALQGAALGAFIGAAQAAITGGDLMKGALRGAAYGGVTGGVVSTIGQMSGVDEFSAESRLKSMGASPTGEETMVQNMGSQSDFTGNRVASGDPTSQGFGGAYTGLPPASSESSILNPGTSDTFGGMSDAKAKILAGIGQGAMQGGGAYLSAREKAKADEDLLERKAQIERDKIKANQPGKIMKPYVANLDTKTWWEQHLDEKTGLLTTGKGVA